MKKVLVISFCLLLLAGWFYWFQLRPTSIKQNCYKHVSTVCSNNPNIDCSFEVRENAYKLCLQKNGL